MFESDTQESAETSVESSSNSESQSVAATPSEPSQQEAASNVQKEAPFHEHPRFKELVQQKNEYAQKTQQYEQSLAQMQSKFAAMEQQLGQYNQSQKPTYDPLFDRLKGIDPEFQGLVKSMYDELQQLRSVQDKIPQLEEFANHSRAEKTAAEANSKLESLYSSNKVSSELRPFYDAQIKARVYELETNGQRLSVRDLDSIFKDIHDSTSKFYEGIRRKERESYVSEKKKDAAPATQTGGAAAGIPSQQMTREDARKLLVNEMRRAKEQI